MLTVWEDEKPAAHRGAAYLFATYFHERFGDEGTRALTAQPLNGTAGFDAALAELGADLTFEDFILSPSVEESFDGLATLMVRTAIQGCVLESVLSEHLGRVISIRNATDNA